MVMMKPAIVLAVGGTLLAACGTSNGPDAAGGGGASRGQQKVTFVQGVTANAFYTSAACGMQNAASNLGVELSVQGPTKFDPALQIQVVHSVIASKPDGMIISSTDAAALVPTLRQAKEAGIKVMMFDGNPAEAGMDIPIGNIQSDNVASGKAAAEALAKLAGGKGDFLAIATAPGVKVGDERLAGVKEGLKAFPGMNLLPVQYAANDTAKAASIVKSTVLAHPDLVAVWGQNQNTTQGIITGVQTAGKVGSIKIGGNDISPPVEEALRKGDAQAIVIQHPYEEGQVAIKNMVGALGGKSIPREVTVPFVLGTPENIDSANVQGYVYKTSC